MKKICSACQAEVALAARFCKMCGSMIPNVETAPPNDHGLKSLTQEQLEPQTTETSRGQSDAEEDQDHHFSGEIDDLAWFYMNNKKKVGPIPGFMVRDLVGLGDIVEDTLLWNPGLSDWKSASELGFVEAVAEVVKEEVKVANESEPTAEQEWFISRAEEQFGPYTWAQIIKFSRDGNLHSDDYLWSASLPDWIRAADIEGLIKYNTL